MSKKNEPESHPDSKKSGSSNKVATIIILLCFLGIMPLLIWASLPDSSSQTSALTAIPMVESAVAAATAATCDCTVGQFLQAGRCRVGRDKHPVQGDQPDQPGHGSAFSFNPLRGTVNPGNVQFTSDELGYQARVLLNGFGRVTTCSVSGDGYLGGFKTC